MTDTLMPYPKSESGAWKRKRNDMLESVSQQKYCTSCNRLKPVEEVKIYRGRNGEGMPRCNECQARRLAARAAR